MQPFAGLLGITPALRQKDWRKDDRAMLKARAAPAFEHIKYLIRTKIEQMPTTT